MHFSVSVVPVPFHSGAPVDEDEVVQSHNISPGDYVKVELDPEIFRAMHEGSEEAGWDDLMMEVRSYPYPIQGVQLVSPRSMTILDTMMTPCMHVHVWPNTTS